MKHFKKILITVIFYAVTLQSLFAQGDFTTEWEVPSGWRFEGLIKLNSGSNVYYLTCSEILNEHNVRFYNAVTHNPDYNWTWTGSNSYFDIRGILGINYGSGFLTNSFDVNNDGINEVIQQFGSSAPEKIINPVNGSVLFSAQTTDDIFRYFGDVDNDGYVEIIAEINGVTKIISTTAQIVSVSDNTEVVKNYELKQNYPNPFNPSTTIEYTLSKPANVKVTVYDMLGKEIKNLVNEKQPLGNYKLNVNASGLSSGTYFYNISVDGVQESRKMMLVK